MASHADQIDALIAGATKVQDDSRSDIVAFQGNAEAVSLAMSELEKAHRDTQVYLVQALGAGPRGRRVKDAVLAAEGSAKRAKIAADQAILAIQAAYVTSTNAAAQLKAVRLKLNDL